MPGEINIRRDDILWRFYCKRFTIKNEEIVPPTNLCPYFWTAVKGFGLWLGYEVSLARLWLIGLTTTLLLFGGVWISAHTNNVFVFTAIMAIVLLWFFTVTPTAMITIIRTMRIVELRAPWVIPLVGMCIAVFMFVDAVTHGGFSFASFLKFFKDWLPSLGYIIAGEILIMGAVILFALYSPDERLEKIQRAFHTMGAFVKAKKNRFCPRVNPPEEFDTRKENQS